MTDALTVLGVALLVLAVAYFLIERIVHRKRQNGRNS